MSNTRFWLWAAMAFGPGNPRVWDFIGKYKSADKMYEALKSGENKFLRGSEIRNVTTTHMEQCEEVMAYCDEKGYRIITYEDEDYPILLRQIACPPAVLYCMGNLDNFNSMPALACVGTRTPSAYSVDVTDRICSEVAARGFAIVSGFAVGIDSAAHRAAYRMRGCTVAVLACGLDVDYPKPNASAKEKIARYGLIISEYPPGTKPKRFTFQMRNRLISGLAFGTLVTEAAEGSGSLITAEHTIDQGRTLFIVPPADIYDKRYAGVIKYLREGAMSVYGSFDILQDYYSNEGIRQIFKKRDASLFPKNRPLNEADDSVRDSRSPEERRKSSLSKKSEEQRREVANKGEAASGNGQVRYKADELTEKLNDKQRRIVEMLRSGDKYIEEMSVAVEWGAFEFMEVLTELEMIGVVNMRPDKKCFLSLSD